MLILIELAAAASACAASMPAVEGAARCTSAASALAVEPMLGGGWRDVATDDEGVQRAASFAAQELGGELGEVESVSRQVVAGLNYRLLLTLSDRRKFDVVVFRALSGAFSLTSSEEVGDTGGNEPTED